MHSSRMRFAHSSPYGGISVQGSGVSVQGGFYQGDPVRNVEPETETPKKESGARQPDPPRLLL